MKKRIIVLFVVALIGLNLAGAILLFLGNTFITITLKRVLMISIGLPASFVILALVVSWLRINAGRFILVCFLIAGVFLTYAVIEPLWLELKEVTIKSDVPASFDGVKIAFICDIHHGSAVSRDKVRDIVEYVNKLNPDIVLLGGDYIEMSPRYIKPCFEELQKLKAPLGRFGVLGNHDHWESAEITRQSMKDAGITLIDNSAQWIYKGEGRIKIGGVGDLTEDVQDIKPTIGDVAKEDFVILISHNPDYVEKIKNHKIDLVLSGHTHGGQITFFGLWAPLVPSNFGQKYRTGIVDTPYTKVIISNGVGQIIPPLRFFARPQVYVIELKSI